MNFAEATQYLFGLGHETLAIKLGLRNTELLLEKLGNPQKFFDSVQIAGTNGKGSTAVVLDSICRTAGIKTGLYTSPHLVSIRERIKVGGHEITEKDFALYTHEVRRAADELVASGTLEALPTFFEHVTAIALLAFREAKVKLAILETGLGGRLDATTVAGAQTVAITPVALDHQRYLGDTLPQIAAEKAAIIRPGVTAVVAQQPPAALEVILKRCLESNVFPSLDDCAANVEGANEDGRFVVTFQTQQSKYGGVVLGLRGKHQIANVGVAIRLAESLRDRGFEISHDAIIQGIQTATHAGRLEVYPREIPVVLDGAHNTSGALALKDYLDQFAVGPLTLIFGAMRDKGLEEMAAVLFPAAAHLVLTQPENPRAAKAELLDSIAQKILAPEKIVVTSSAREALQMARAVTPPHGLICVTGSLYLIGEIKSLLDAEEDSKAAKGST